MSTVISAWAAETRRRDALLWSVGIGHLVLCLLFIIAVPFDHRTILGLSPWIKPFKFASSITIFVWTIAWLIGYLVGAAGTRRFISRSIAVAMVTEMALITLQALRGTTSHFNIASGAFNAVVFSVMGVMILFNTIVVGVFAVLYFRQRPAIEAGLLWGIRLGLLIFLMASAEGVVMVRRLAHTVGAADGGPGLPLVNWSTVAGDLRVAHFVGLHALQLLPLAGWAVDHFGKKTASSTRAGMIGVAGICYAGLVAWLLTEALSGRPLFRM